MSSKYTVETGPGYLGVWKADRYRAEISIGTYEDLPWRSDDHVVAVDHPDGIAVVEASHVDAVEGERITDLSVHKNTVGTNVSLPARVGRLIDGLEPDGDVRGYRLDTEGFVVVAADDDPMLDRGDDGGE